MLAYHVRSQITAVLYVGPSIAKAAAVVIIVLLYSSQVYHEESPGLMACGLANCIPNEPLVKGWCPNSGRLKRLRTSSHYANADNGGVSAPRRGSSTVPAHQSYSVLYCTS